MSTSSQSNAGGIGFFGLLAIVFITLKLMGYITWPWWIVLSPIWGYAIIIGIVLLVLIIWHNSRRG